MSIQTKVFQLPWPTWCLFNKTHFLSMDNKLTLISCPHKNVQYTNPNVTAVTSTCNIRWQTAVPHCACNTDDTRTDGKRRKVGKSYMKQQEIKFTFKTEQCNSSLITAMWKTVDAVQLSWNKKTINDNNCHTVKGPGASEPWGPETNYNQSINKSINSYS